MSHTCLLPSQCIPFTSSDSNSNSNSTHIQIKYQFRIHIEREEIQAQTQPRTQTQTLTLTPTPVPTQSPTFWAQGTDAALAYAVPAHPVLSGAFRVVRLGPAFATKLISLLLKNVIQNSETFGNIGKKINPRAAPPAVHGSMAFLWSPE
jgi:hypothetical protein